MHLYMNINKIKPSYSVSKVIFLSPALSHIYPYMEKLLNLSFCYPTNIDFCGSHHFIPIIWIKDIYNIFYEKCLKYFGNFILR